MVPMTTRQKYDVVPMSYDGLTMALHSRIQHEIEPSCVLPVFFWYVKDFGAARDGDADGLKCLPMDIRWVTMHSRMARSLHDPRQN